MSHSVDRCPQRQIVVVARDFEEAARPSIPIGKNRWNDRLQRLRATRFGEYRRSSYEEWRILLKSR